MTHTKKPGNDVMVLVRTLVMLVLRYGMPKCHLIEIISDQYDLERDNRRSPQ